MMATSCLFCQTLLLIIIDIVAIIMLLTIPPAIEIKSFSENQGEKG